MDDAVTQWSRHLIELGGANNLLWARDGSPTDVDLSRAHPGGLARLLSGAAVRLSELVREPSALTVLTARAQALHRQVTAIRVQHGLLTAYLAMGTATWQQPGQVPRAPVILWPAKIAQDHTGAIVVRLAGDVQVNPALASYLNAQGILLDHLEVLRASRSADAFDLSQAFEVVQRAGSALPGFRIERSRFIDSFNHVKATNARDLTDQRGWLETHDVVAALAGDQEARAQLAAQPPTFVPPAPQDEVIALDLDEDQQAVVEAVRAGAHLSVHAPPGCGTTQTIAGLATALAMDGRRTLVVSQTWAGGDALLERLTAAGLSDLVLDVREDAAAALTHRLRAQLANLAALPPGTRAPKVDTAGPLTQQIERLEREWRAEHQERSPWGVSPAQCRQALGRMSAGGWRGSDQRLDIDSLVAVSVERCHDLAAALQQAADAGAWRADRAPDPWFGARVVGGDQRRRTGELVAGLADGGLKRQRDEWAALADEVGLPAPLTVREAEAHLELMAGAFLTLETFDPQVFGAALPAMVAATADENSGQPANTPPMGLLERRRLRTQAKRLLRPGVAAVNLHGVLVRAMRQRTQWQTLAGKGSIPAAPLRTPEIAARTEKLRQQLEWLEARLVGTIAHRALLDCDLDRLQVLLEELRDADDRLGVVPTVIASMDLLRANGFAGLIDELADRGAGGAECAEQVRWVWWNSVLEHSQRTDAVLADHDAEKVRRDLADFQAADNTHVAHGAEQLRERVRKQVERIREDLPDQVATVRSRVLHPGALLKHAPELLTAMRPVWLVSPLAVASMVAPGLWFDVVVFEDAGQLPLPESMPAISRAGQVVVFGDRTQETVLPRVLSAPPAPSLMRALEPLVPGRSLTRDYRSRDERLTAFAGQWRYGGEVAGFPAPAGARTPIEARPVHEDRVLAGVVAALREQLANDPEASIVIVLWSTTLADRVRSELLTRTGDPLIQRRLGDADGSIVVGDIVSTRAVVADVAIVVIAHEAGAAALLQTMGSEGAMVRLWSAVSRATRRMVVLSTLDPQTFPDDRLRTSGARALRDFLRYAHAGGDARGLQAQSLEQATTKRRRRAASGGSVLDQLAVAPSAAAEVPVLVDRLATALRERGLVAQVAYGVSGRPVELAVHAGSGPVLAVETDAFGYGDGLRTRARLRPQVLQERGWTYELVCSQDLFADVGAEADRLAALLAEGSA